MAGSATPAGPAPAPAPAEPALTSSARPKRHHPVSSSEAAAAIFAPSQRRTRPSEAGPFQGAGAASPRRRRPAAACDGDSSALVSSWQRPSRSAASRSRRSEQQRGAGSQELSTQGQSSALACDGREARPEGGKVARAPPAPGGRRRAATERSGQGCVRAHRGDPPAPLGGRGCSARRRGWVSSPLLPREACPSLPCRGRGTAAGQRSVRGAACSTGSGRGKGASGER